VDEAGFESDAPLARTYGLKGTTPVVETSSQRQSIHGIRAVNARGEIWAVTYDGKLDAESFVLLLKNFMKGCQGKGFLIMDGHPSHTAKAGTKEVEGRTGRSDSEKPTIPHS
jgi:hypothetical protein